MYCVLVVDDEMPALRFVRSIIEQFAKDFQVVATASSGEHALEYLRQQSVDLLITDISMHGMSGIELAQAARVIQASIHIVIISGYGEFEYAQSAIQVGVDDYLLKPVSISKNDRRPSIRPEKAGERKRKPQFRAPARYRLRPSLFP